MYPGMVNSPVTTLSEAYTHSPADDHIHVTELAVFPDPEYGNLCTIGTGIDAVTYLYTGKSGASGSGTLTGVSVVEGTDKSWDSGTIIARNFTCHDHDTFIDNLTESPVWMSRNAVVNSNFDVWQRLGTKIETTKRARSSNVATLTTSAAHNLITGDKVCIFGLGGTGYNTNSATVASTPSSTTFTFSNTGSDEGETADTGGDIYCYDHPVFIDPEDFTADRWSIDSDADSGSFPTLLHTRGAITPGDMEGSHYYYKVTTDGAGSSLGDESYYVLSHAIVYGTPRLCGANKTITLSFKARSTIAGKKIGACFIQDYGSDGSSAEYIIGEAWTLTSSWTTYSYTFTTNTLSGKTIMNNNSLILGLFLEWGADYAALIGESEAEDFGGAGVIEIAQVQVCSGDVALDYAPPDPIQELVTCKMDYERLGGFYGIQGLNCACTGLAVGSDTAWGYMTFSPKRVVPTVSTVAETNFRVFHGAGGFNIHNISSLTIAEISISAITIGLNSMGNYSTGDVALLFHGDPVTYGYIEVYTGL